MGNAPSARYSPSPPPSQTHYTVHCYKHTWINVYDGYDEYWYNHYRNTYTPCSECVGEENRRQEELARQRLQREKEIEEERVKALKEKAERDERDRQERERRRREEERREEQRRFVEERQRKEAESIKLQKELISAEQRKIEAEINRLQNIKPSNPYIAWKKCDTFKIVQDIGNEALKYSVTGEVICQRVGEIKNELKQSLADDYKIVAPEIKRYDNYGKEMKSMTKEFVDVFGKVFKTKVDNQKTEFDSNADDLKEAKEDQDQEDIKTFQEMMQENVKELEKAINTMRFKLLLMKENYCKMQQDFKFFIGFIKDKKSEYKQQEENIANYLSGISDNLISKGQRDIFEGQKDEKFKQKDKVEVEFDIKIHSYKTKEVKIGERKVKVGGGDYALEGALVGMAAGATVGMVGGACIGAAFGGPVGVVAGAAAGGLCGGAIGGAILGACIGSLFKMKTRTRLEPIMETEKRTVITTTKRKLDVTIKKQYYDGNKHYRALYEIKDALKGPIDKMIEELKQAEDSKQKQLDKFVALEQDVVKLLNQVEVFGKNVGDLKTMINNDVKDSHKKLITKKWNKTAGDIKGILASMADTNSKE